MQQDKVGISARDVEAVIGARHKRAFFSKRPWILAFSLALACAAAFGYWRFSAAPPSASGGLTYITRPAEVAALTLRVTGTGSVQPTNKVDISSELLALCGRCASTTIPRLGLAMSWRFSIP